MKYLKWICVALVFIGAISACGRDVKLTSAGKVVFAEIEGGFWGIVTEDGQRIVPDEIPAMYCVDGLDIYFSYTPNEETVTIYQWGIPVSLNDIRIE